MQSLILAIEDQDIPFHVICDAIYFAIGCPLMQFDTDGAERVICYQSRQLQAADRNYPVHDKELLAMKYALAKFESISWEKDRLSSIRTMRHYARP